LANVLRPAGGGKRNEGKKGGGLTRGRMVGAIEEVKIKPETTSRCGKEEKGGEHLGKNFNLGNRHHTSIATRLAGGVKRGKSQNWKKRKSDLIADKKWVGRGSGTDRSRSSPTVRREGE